MGDLRPEKLCTNRKRAIEELVMGRDVAAQLQLLLRNPTGDHGSASSADELVVKILRSFTVSSHSILTCSCETSEECRIPAVDGVGSLSSVDRRSVDSGESRKRPSAKDPRGSYKRRKTSDSWVNFSTTMEDDHAWRKYGQKDILNAKFPRCYFRCTHKPDQGCLATKQVQKIKEEPHTMYQTTYFGQHTCRSNTLPKNILASDFHVEPYVLSFESKKNVTSDQDHRASNTPAASVKAECDKEETQSNFSGNVFPAVDPIVWPEEVISSCTTSSHGLEMDFLMECVDFDNGHFPFGHEAEFPLGL